MVFSGSLDNAKANILFLLAMLNVAHFHMDILYGAMHVIEFILAWTAVAASAFISSAISAVRAIS